jgi:hypothetical protein
VNRQEGLSADSRLFSIISLPSGDFLNSATSGFASRDYAKRGESLRVSPEAFGLDPERIQGGHMRMTLIDRSGERVQCEYEDGDYVDFR